MDTRTQQPGKTAEHGTSQQTNPGLEQTTEKAARGGGYGAVAVPASEHRIGTTQPKTAGEPGMAGQVIEQVKEGVSSAYETTSKGLNKGYNMAVDYGKSNPGKMTMIAFGVGLGVGLMISNGFTGRGRRSRIIPPIMDALSQIATEMFR
ncbi:MAG TPA: hypothetical protein VKM94_09025 [Blastocatellia bacterium]|nr:hypothetical protein [Blastocatellia bacterium]